MTNLVFQQADCLKFLKKQPDNSVDLILTDPPYFRFLSAAWDRQWKTREEYLAWLEPILVEYRRVLKPSGSLYLFASPRMSSHVECLIAKHFNVLNHIVWRKNSGPHNKACKEQLRAYFAQTERIIFAEQLDSARQYDKQCAALKGDVFEPLRLYLVDALERSGITRKQIEAATGNQMHGHWFGKSQWQLPSEKDYKTLQLLFNGFLSKDYDQVKRRFKLLNKTYLELKEAHADLRRHFAVTKHVPFTDVWDFNPTPARPGRHPCEKPLPLIEHIINASSRPGQVVMDTFVGSGSTPVAALKLGRKFVGCELGKDEFQQAKKRLICG